MGRLLFDVLVAGQMFTYEGQRISLFGRGVGIGQVLGLDTENKFVFVELFGTRDEELVPFIGFVPLTYDAFARSKPRMTKVLEVPESWEHRRNVWLTRWSAGDAGAFSIALREVVANTVETVGRANGLDDGTMYIELAFPRRDASGVFRTIEAHAIDLV